MTAYQIAKEEYVQYANKVYKTLPHNEIPFRLRTEQQDAEYLAAFVPYSKECARLQERMESFQEHKDKYKEFKLTKEQKKEIMEKIFA